MYGFNLILAIVIVTLFPKNNLFTIIMFILIVMKCRTHYFRNKPFKNLYFHKKASNILSNLVEQVKVWNFETAL